MAHNYTSVDGRRLQPGDTLRWPTNVPRPQIPSTEGLSQEADKLAAQQLKQQFDRAAGEIKLQIDDEQRAINNQFRIRQQAMRVKFDAERDPQKKSAIEKQMADIKTQFEGKLQAVRDKHHPAVRSLNNALSAEVDKLRTASRERNIKLQTLRDFAAENPVDPALIKQYELKLLGVDAPLSSLRPQPNVEQRKAQLKRDIQSLDSMLKSFTPAKAGGLRYAIPGGRSPFGKKATMTDPLTGKEVKLDPETEQGAAVISKMMGLHSQREEKLRQYQQLLLQDPRYRAAVEGSRALQNANKIMNGTKKQGGGLKETMTVAVNKDKRVRVKSPSGQTGTVTQKELAGYLAQGFERIQ